MSVVCKKLVIFSDGSSVLSYKLYNKTNQIFSNFTKDLKSFQKLTKQNSLTSFYNVTLTNKFRKNLFK